MPWGWSSLVSLSSSVQSESLSSKSEELSPSFARPIPRVVDVCCMSGAKEGGGMGAGAGGISGNCCTGNDGMDGRIGICCCGVDDVEGGTGREGFAVIGSMPPKGSGLKLYFGPSW